MCWSRDGWTVHNGGAFQSTCGVFGCMVNQSTLTVVVARLYAYVRAVQVWRGRYGGARAADIIHAMQQPLGHIIQQPLARGRCESVCFCEQKAGRLALFASENAKSSVKIVDNWGCWVYGRLGAWFAFLGECTVRVGSGEEHVWEEWTCVRGMSNRELLSYLPHITHTHMQANPTPNNTISIYICTLHGATPAA